MSRLRGFEKLGNVTRVIFDSTLVAIFPRPHKIETPEKFWCRNTYSLGHRSNCIKIRKRVNIPGLSNLAPQSVLPILDLCMLARVWRVLWSLNVDLYAVNTYIPPSGKFVHKAYSLIKWIHPDHHDSWPIYCKSVRPFRQVPDMCCACIAEPRDSDSWTVRSPVWKTYPFPACLPH